MIKVFQKRGVWCTQKDEERIIKWPSEMEARLASGTQSRDEQESANSEQLAKEDQLKDEAYLDKLEQPAKLEK